MVIRGALNVFLVVIAIDLLDMGEAGTGVLAAAMGAGAILGSLAATGLVHSRSLGRWLGVGVALWGIPFVGLALVPGQESALVALALVGVGNVLVDIGFFPVMMRLVPDGMLSRVFGADEALAALAIGLGSLIAPLLIELVGIRWAIGIVGASGPLATLITWRSLARIDHGLLKLGDDADC